jgi:DNA-binding MarR family transcriptional regulator
MAGSDAGAPRERLGFMIYRSGLAVSRGFERALKPIETTPSEAGVLSALAYSGPNHVRGLARLLGLGRQTIVNVARRLEEQRLVERSASKEDARLSVFGITMAGRRKLSAVEKIATAFDEQLRTIVGSQREADLTQVLQRIVDAPFLAYED